MAEGFGSAENGNPANAYADALARARQVKFYVCCCLYFLFSSA